MDSFRIPDRRGARPWLRIRGKGPMKFGGPGRRLWVCLDWAHPTAWTHRTAELDRRLSRGGPRVVARSYALSMYALTGDIQGRWVLNGYFCLKSRLILEYETQHTTSTRCWLANLNGGHGHFPRRFESSNGHHIHYQNEDSHVFIQ